MAESTLQESGRLGGYREYRPPPDLRSVVESSWFYSRPFRCGMPIPGAGHRVLPETSVSLCLRAYCDDGGRAEEPELIFIGPTRSIRYFAPDPGLCLAAVRLKPEWCRDLLRIDPSEHANEQNRISIRTGGVRLRDRLAFAEAPQAVLSILLDEIRELRDSARFSRAAALAHAGLETIRAEDTRLHAVAGRLSLSERTLRRAVVEMIGVGPKRVQRVLRLHRTVATADPQAAPDWSRLAAENGFFDQSHLIAEFRSLTGRTPGELHAERQLQQPRCPESPRRS